MKKFLSFMACTAMVCAGAMTLTACGGSKDEFAKAKTVSADEVAAYIASEQVENSFATGYTLNADMFGVKMNATVGVTTEDKLQASILIGFPATEDTQAQTVQSYVKDDYAYFDLPESDGGKMKISMNTQDDGLREQLQQIEDGLHYIDDMTAEIQNYITHLGTDGTEIKKLAKGDSVKFRFKYSDNQGTMTFILSYKQNKLVGFNLDTTMYGITPELNETIKIELNAFSGTINFPADLADYTDAEVSEPEPSPEPVPEEGSDPASQLAA